MALPGDDLESGNSAIICKRCNENEATHKIRSESVCAKCFAAYVTTKAVKRMETFKVRASSSKAPRKFLLPLSFGPSSASLLYILDQHLRNQYERMNRAAYELYVVHIDLYLDEADKKESADLLEKYKGLFSRHTYCSHGLDEALSLGNIDWKALGISSLWQGTERTSTERLQQLIGSMPSATSKADIISTLLTRLLVEVAKENGCESILFADSTTRLAEKTLTETAKGRGFSLPWQVSDGASPYGVGFNYPLRDILKKEVVAFTSLTAPSIKDLVKLPQPLSQISASSKTTTIDDLMVQYFESVEENFPSIVANVVRTSSKLNPLTNIDASACSVCGLPVAEGTDGIYGWGGDQNSVSRAATEDTHRDILCYGCSRSING
ncbi:cytoplasmic tRNA 2-thiolation protein 2 [Coleophoma cylindrospora]|uniref:Cytoplasmic tRNA 2-thiolation protein 2 n=1 Tax=Coleophoma cylindrospora TaxID=1849047 RepID=A0A3D8SR08_9HELO|nr:cytoplasmic tRNA 2-thiolation protein 2 [Coleophoma cylindrospora]